MSACEKCWSDAIGLNMPYDLLLSRKHGREACTPEQQAGPGAMECPICKRWTLHQYTGQPMCGCPKPSASTDDNVPPSRSLPSSVECPKCRTQLAFEGDECGLCKEDEA